jgi:hypothetical protein
MSTLLPSISVYRQGALTSVVFVLWLLVPFLVYADQFTGKVVGISDGTRSACCVQGKHLM